MSEPTPDRDTAGAAVRHACDLLRTVPGLGQDHILAMFFLKSISDAWQDSRERHGNEHGDHPELVAELMRNERFVLPPDTDFRALHAERHRPGNGERIDRALHAIEEANPAKLRDLFRNASFNAPGLGDEARKNDGLRQLLEAFALPASTLDAIGDTFELLIGITASTGDRKSGAFPTPPEVARLMARLMAPEAGDEICDPTCGAGSLLIACGQQIRARTGRRDYALHGQEIDGHAWALARMNLFLHGEDNHRVEWGDTLRQPKLLDGEGRLRQFDIVVADPPFSNAAWGHDAAARDPHRRFRRGLPPRTRGDYAFVLHMVETMRPRTGRMAVVVPHGVLFRGASEASIRRRLVEENLLDAVIGLPEKLFDGTGIPAAILVLRRTRTDDKVLFVDASRACQAGKNRNLLRAADVDAIVAAVEARRGVAGFACLASIEEIAGHDFNLNIPRYVDTFEAAAAPSIDPAAVREERSALKAELAALDERMAGYLKALGGA
ncbi:MAG: class I SAM-dependent DNA methyltransferase [Luteimonas sp.]